MTEVEEFLDEMLPRQLAAEHALCGGDDGPRALTWSQRDPVTLFGGAVLLRRGWGEVSAVFRWLAGRLTELRAYDFELVAAGASGDLAYTVGFEHKTLVADGEESTYTLRVTHVYRREDGQWRIVHRHGDRPPADVVPR
ncbi:nuclear transport factor 2 family protein [Actinomycetospora lutea]|uniref:nuclear transport factor 2 family protein n=1 Tax=Actinomycetospora lutea TaxID=663604 RepID=UPI002366766C|nr:nuclear transport factor 2 family protein [Actinomycetospora lutea]MDD7936964.1 nuclear transport factor 2 family protein [Actinomycetospora lutea]